MDTLMWKVSDQKLKQPRWDHVTFPITQNAYINLINFQFLVFYDETFL